MSRQQRPAPPLASFGACSPVRRWAVAAVLGCGMTITAGGCGAARQTVARPVTGVLRSVPVLGRFAPAPKSHRPPPPPAPAIAPPPPSVGPSVPSPDRRWEPGTGSEDPFSAPLEYAPDPPPPSPLPAPMPRTSGGRQPTLISPPGDRSPSTRPSLAPSGGPAPPPPGSLSSEDDPRAYYPVGKRRIGGPMASLWQKISGRFGFGSKNGNDASAARLVSHEIDEEDSAKRRTVEPAETLSR